MSNLDEAIDSTDPLIRVDSGYPEVPRITLSLNEILKSKKMVLLITDQEKVDLLKAKRDNSSSLPIDALIEKADNLEILLAE
jgi:6-phosphogluconolactonase/glucosamine-6-phosphate isomerase/deaminase